MSNLVEELQNGLISNKKLYSQIKNEEIINLIENYKDYPSEYKLYDIYFNNRCKNDYMIFLLSNINNKIEKSLKKDKEEILEMKLEMLFEKYKGDIKKLIKQFKVNKEDLVKNIGELKELKQKIEIKKELKRDSKKEKERYDNVITNLDKIIEEEFGKYFETKEKSNFLKDYIKYLVKINKRLLNMRVSSDEYNKYLIKKLTENDYDNVEDLIESNKVYDYVDNEELSFMILKYKEIKNETLESLILEFPDDITEEFIEKYRSLYIKNVDLNDTFEKSPEEKYKIIELKSSEIKYHLLIEIIEICPQPKNDRYLEYLREIYIENDMEKEYEEIVEKNKEIKEMLIEFEDEELTFTKSIIKKIKNKEDYKEELLTRSLNEDMDEEEYANMLKEYEMIEKLITYNDYGILDSYVSTKISSILQEMIDFNLTTNINELKKNMKANNEDDQYIKEQLYKSEIDRKNKSSYIYVSVNDMFKNDNIINFFNFYRKLEKKLEILSDEKIMKDLETIIQNTMSQLLDHYLKAINHYKTLEKKDRLYYNLNEDEEVRVYVKDYVMELLEYVLKNLNEEGEFIYKHLLKHIFEYKYYNVLLETEETISEKLHTDILMINYNNKINLINNVFKKSYNKNEIKELNERIAEYMRMKIQENIFSNKKYSSYYKIVDLNEKYNILTEKEIKYLKTQWIELSFLSLGNLIKGKGTEEKALSALNFIKLFVNELDLKMKEKKININNEKNKKEIKEQVDMIKELKRLMKGEYKILKGEKVKVENIYVNNVIDIGSKIEDIELTTLTIKKFQKMYNENTNENKKDKLINDSVNNTIKMLETIFEYKYEEKEMIIRTMLEEKNKFEIIAKRNTRNLDYKNIYERLSKEQKNLYDIVKYITILYYIDGMLNEGKDLEKTLKKNKKEEKVNMINKKVYVIKDKSIKKIVKKEEKKGQFKINGKTLSTKIVYITKDGKKLDRFDFILLDTLKNKVCKITRGVYKGQYGRLMSIKEMQYFTKQLKKNKNIENKYYQDLIKKLNDNKLKIQSAKKDRLINSVELEALETYRKNLNLKDKDGKKIYEDKYALNIRLNPKLNKVLGENEERFLKEYREEKIKEIEYQKMIYRNKLRERKENKNQYVVKINEGQKNQKNIYLDMNSVIINTEGLVNKEIIEMIKETRNDMEITKVESLYELTKKLFEYQNLNIDNKLEYFTNMYKESIEIFNYNKMNRMNRILIEEKLIEKIRKIKKNIKILTLKLKQETIKKEEKQLLGKLKRVLKIKTNELEKMKIEIEKEKLRKYYNVELKDYKDELKVESNIMYYKMNENRYKEDIEEIKRLKVKQKEEEKKQEEKLKVEINKLINKFKEELYLIMRESPEEKVKLIKYVRENLLKLNEDSDDEESINLDELELELDGIFENDEESEELESEKPKEQKRELTWLELMDLPDDYEYSDWESEDFEI